MSFASRPTQTRFSLLLLEEQEYYFYDHGVTLRPPSMDGPQYSSVHRREGSVHGRLKVCSHSLVFDPDDEAIPVMRLPLKDVQQIVSIRGRKGAFAVLANSRTEMKENGIDAPYRFLKEPGTYEFTLKYAPVDACVPFIENLHHMASLRDEEFDERLKAMIAVYESKIKFDHSWLDDLSERTIVETRATRITPMIEMPGRLLVTDQRLYFQPYNNVSHEPVQRFRLSDVSIVLRRIYMCEQTALELLFGCAMESGSDEAANSLFVVCETVDKREEVLRALKAHAPYDAWIDSVANRDDYLLDARRRWDAGELDNFGYLMILNRLAGRSFNDLTQYPVFPWVLLNYEDGHCDLASSSAYRDLSKPIGALNADRLETFRERYREMPEPKFMYGTHYSTPGYVLYYLVRDLPSHMLRLQQGRFDAPDRMFFSVEAAWRSVMANSADLKELIPQFYEGDGEFLVNHQGLDMGARQNGQKVGDVELPQWSSTAFQFVRKMREALESEQCTAQIHEWIDLIFGVKQRGERAVEADNLFHPVTYSNAGDVATTRDPVERRGLLAQVREFGQTPLQLFRHEHPGKGKPAAASDTRVEISMPDGDVLLERLPTPPSMHALTPPRTPSSGPLDASPLSSPRRDGDLAGSRSESAASSAAGCLSPAARVPVSAGRPRWRQSLRARASGISLSDDASHIHVSLHDGTIAVLTVEGKLVGSFAVSDLALSSCASIPHADVAVVGSWDNSLYLFAREFGRAIDSFEAHDDAVSSVAVQGNLMVTGSWDSTVKVWSVSPSSLSRSPLHELVEHDDEVRTVCLRDDGSVALSGSADGITVLWDVESGVPLAKSQLHGGAVTCSAFVGESLVATGGEDGTLRLWDARFGRPALVLNAYDAVKCVAHSGFQLLYGTAAGSIVAAPLAEGESPRTSDPFQTSSVQGTGDVSLAALCFLSDYDFVSVDDEGEIVRWSAS